MLEYTLARPASEQMLDYVYFLIIIDTHSQKVSFFPVFSRLRPAAVVELWGMLLCERRVIVTSDNLELLSSFVSATTALLYPFSWQVHISVGSLF